MPVDDRRRQELEAVVRKCADEGTPELAADALIQLASLVDQAGDGSAAAALLPKLAVEGLQHPLLTQAMEDLKHLLAQSDVTGTDFSRGETVSPASPAFVGLKLLYAGMINEGEYIVLIEDIARAVGAGESPPPSALHLLDRRGRRDIEKIALCMAEDSAVPLLPMARFHPSAEAYSLVPFDIVEHGGAMPFGFMDEKLLVAVLNPYDNELQREVARLSGRECRFYLALPVDYDDTVGLLRAAMDDII